MAENEVITLTLSQARALQILRAHEITYASQFGRFFFGSDHPSWRRIGKCGHGSTRGVGMRLGSGGFLGKLRKAGLINYGGHGRAYYLTALGERSLDQFETLQRNDQARAAIIYSPDKEDEN